MNVAHLVLPRQTRQWLRRTYDALRFDAAMKRFIADPRAALNSGNPVLADLISAWGNSGWIAQDGYLRACLHTALEVDGPTLECGSGLSTLLLGVVADQRGHEHWALEHLPEWGTKVGGFVARYGFRNVRLHTAPLREYGGFTWYDPPLLRLPHTFALVVCDGPPADTPGGRYGLVPLLRDYLASGCIILLDDAVRTEERSIARRWQAEFGTTNQLVGDEKPFIRIVVPKPCDQVAGKSFEQALSQASGTDQGSYG